MPEQNYPLDDELSIGAESDVPVSETSRRHLQQTATWVQVLAITNMGSAVLQILSMFIVLTRMRMIMHILPVEGNNYILAVIIIYLLFSTFTGLIGWQLWNYSTHLKAALHFDDKDKLDLSYYYQYRYFKTLGWMVIAALVLMVLSAVFFITLFTLYKPDF